MNNRSLVTSSDLIDLSFLTWLTSNDLIDLSFLTWLIYNDLIDPAWPDWPLLTWMTSGDTGAGAVRCTTAEKSVKMAPPRRAAAIPVSAEVEWNSALPTNAKAQEMRRTKVVRTKEWQVYVKWYNSVFISMYMSSKTYMSSKLICRRAPKIIITSVHSCIQFRSRGCLRLVYKSR